MYARTFLLAMTLAPAVFLPPPLLAREPEESVFEGTWKTTNRKLDGTMKCVLTEVGDERYRGRFSGIWQGVDFDYTVDFTGPPSALRGAAVIDGADYEWKGTLEGKTPRRFAANFSGSRYQGSFELREKPRATTTQD